MYRNEEFSPRAATAHKEAVAAQGCIICREFLDIFTPPEIHHIRSGHGMAQRAPDFLILPLCADHHRTGGVGVAIHAGQKTWENLYGSELYLLARVTERLTLDALRRAA